MSEPEGSDEIWEYFQVLKISLLIQTMIHWILKQDRLLRNHQMNGRLCSANL